MRSGGSSAGACVWVALKRQQAEPKSDALAVGGILDTTERSIWAVCERCDADAFLFVNFGLGDSYLNCVYANFSNKALSARSSV